MAFHSPAIVTLTLLGLLLPSCNSGGGGGVLPPPSGFRLLGSDPAPGSVGSTEGPFRVWFAGELDPSTIATAIRLADPAADLPVRLTLTAGGTACLLQPLDELPPDRPHAIVISATLRSIAGEVLAQPIFIPFRTAVARAWQPPQTLGHATADASRLHASTGADGSACAAWSVATDAWTMRWRDGTGWGVEHPGSGELRAVTVSADRHACALITRRIAQSIELQAHGAAAGAPFVHEALLASLAAGFGRVLLGGCDDGSALALWSTAPAEPAGVGLASRSSRSTWTPADFPLPDRVSSLRLATHPAGDAVAVWDSDPDLLWASWRPRGGFAMRAVGHFGFGPRGAVAVLPGGSVHVWLAGDPMQPDVMLRLLPGSGMPGPVERLDHSSLPILALRIGAGAAGDLLVAWVTRERASDLVYARRFDPELGHWGLVDEVARDVGPVRPGPDGEPEPPFAIAIDRDGAAHVVWRSAVGPAVQARRAARGAVWGATCVLEPAAPGVSIEALQLAAPAPAAVDAYWLRRESSGVLPQVRTARRSSP
jgi:hypothetical protein